VLVPLRDVAGLWETPQVSERWHTTGRSAGLGPTWPTPEGAIKRAQESRLAFNDHITREGNHLAMGRLVRASALVLMQKAIFAEMKSKNNRE
jgi:hypothetical protein